MRTKRGFTFVELVVIMGILGTTLGFMTIRLLGAQRKPQLTTVVDTLVADLRQQQLRAMSGDSGGTEIPINYGIYFTTTGYTLFRSSVYSGSDPANFSVSVATPIKLTTTFPDNVIVFTKGSGEIMGFAGANTITVQNLLSNEQKVIFINQLGVVMDVQ